MAAYLAVGDALQKAVPDASEYPDSVFVYGDHVIENLVASVPELGDVDTAYGMFGLAAERDEVREFILDATATPMGDGQPLTLAHWLWVDRHQPPADGEDLPNAWWHAELDWLRSASPSPAVLAHVEGVLERKHEREMRERLQDLKDRAVDALDGLVD